MHKLEVMQVDEQDIVELARILARDVLTEQSVVSLAIALGLSPVAVYHWNIDGKAVAGKRKREMSSSVAFRLITLARHRIPKIANGNDRRAAVRLLKSVAAALDAKL